MFENQESLKATIKEHLSAALNPNPKPKPKKYRYSLEQEKAQILEMIGKTVRKTVKEVDLNKIIAETIESIDWTKKIREAIDVALNRHRGIVK